MSRPQKKEDVVVGAVRVVYKDAPSDVQEMIVTSATNALKSLYKGEKPYFSDIAQQVKMEVEQAQGGAWHVIVGKSFGSFVSHEVKKMLYFYIGHIGFLVFKHG